LGRLEVGVTEQIGGDGGLVRSGIDQLGHCAMPEQVRPDTLAKSLLGIPLNLMPDRLLRMGLPQRSSQRWLPVLSAPLANPIDWNTGR
jgi:hypothetical protein